MVLYISKDGESYQPYDFEGIQEGLASGYFTGTDWALLEGETEWHPLNNLVDRLRAQSLARKGVAKSMQALVSTDRMPKLAMEPFPTRPKPKA